MGEITAAAPPSGASTLENVPRGLREGRPKRPALEEDAWERIQREQEQTREREFVRFAFYQVAPEWRRLGAEQKAAHRAEFARLVADWGQKLMVYSYSLVGTRGDCDFLLWQASRELDHLHGFAAAIRQTGLGHWLELPYSYFAMTRRSIYLNRYEREYLEKYGGKAPLEHARIAINPQGSKYLFVYPFVKTRDWYALSHEDRQRMMDEHIRIGHEWPDVKLNTTYSYGLDDQEFVVAFETDHVGRFLDLLMALRLSEASRYTLRDTPSFTCTAMSIGECLEALG
ncbi:MAG: chlorite dismutase family protein [Gemmatimonadetes bacterium]|nr:chlorite dismutase family protein [Gemmatimonadota bacterium]